MKQQNNDEIRMNRERLAERFLEHPLLYFFVRAWLLSWRARIAMVLALIMVMGFVLGLPRIWRTTPKDFNPVIRVSLLDELKARVLERNSRKYLKQGRTDYGILALNASISHNQGDLRRIREFLRHVIARQNSRGGVDMDTINMSALRMAMWLRRISKEGDDLALLADLYESLEFDEDLLALLAEDRNTILEPLKKKFVKALFRQGMSDQFEQSWRKWGGQNEWEQDPEMKLYRAAATAIYGQVSKSPEAKEYLMSQLSSERRVIAHRLYAMLCFERRDTDEYLQILKKLEEWRQDRLLDHARGWQLLAAEGRKAEALHLADQFNRAPRTPMETSQLASAYSALGMNKDAQKLLDQYIARFGFYERLWVQQGLQLAQTKEWNDLRNLIAKMRLDPGIAHRMEGLSYFLEGISELGEGRPAAAFELFQKIPEQGIPNMDVAFLVIDQMRRLGHTGIAAQLVAQVEEDAKDIPRYWMFVAQMASDMKNEELLLRATEQYRRLLPDEPAAKSNFAAALLATRQRSQEAIKVTFDLVSSAPDVHAFRINHASALCLNARYKDATETLMQVPLNQLNGLEKTMFYFALTEALVGQEEFAKAEAIAGKIDQLFLYPAQVRALDEWRKKFADVSKPKA